MEEFQSRQMIIRKEQDKMKMLSVVYGSHLPFQLLMERNILSQKTKGIQNINLGLDISLGRDQKLPFPCYIDNRPRFELEINSIKYS